MFLLGESIKKTIAVAEGYKLGRLIYDNDKYLIELEDNTEIDVDGLVIEILNGDEWHRLEEEDYNKFTPEGWPLLAGFDCKYKEDELGIRVPEINTHEKLLTDLLDPVSYRILKSNGFKGCKENFIRSLLYAIEETSAYTSSAELSQKEYFKMLTEKMNNALWNHNKGMKVMK